MLRTVCTSVALCLAAGVVCADITVSSKNRAKIFANQTAVLDGRAAQQYAASVRLKPPTVQVPVVAGPALGYRGRFLQPARDAARRHSVPEDLFLRLVQQESGWNHLAISTKGAIGLAQLMPATARRLGVDPRDPLQNLEGGARYLRRQFDQFRSWRLALAAYNAGPGAVIRHGGVPPYRETQAYVLRIWGS